MSWAEYDFLRSMLFMAGLVVVIWIIDTMKKDD